MTCLEDSLRPEYSPHTEVLGAEFCFPCWDVCLGPSGGCGEPPRDAWGWEPSSSSPSRAVPCLWLAPRSPQLSAPSPAAAPLGWAGRSVPGQPRGQLHAFSGHVSLWAASKAACKHAALALSAQWVQVLMEQEDMGTSLAGRPVPAVSVWLRN